MLQLVYTSAPRLLEAGKTGFGTVARSRELPASLVAYLERLSSFDRSAGVSEYQFYSEYRMGGTRYRIFSRVADCGVDYTRRTNHIAHHLVTAEGDEEETRMAASTPAGVLQALDGAFLRTWTGNPTWLQPQELPAVLPLHGNGSWQQACGQPAYARWLANLPKSGCYLTTAKTYSAAQWLELLHEGFLTCPDHGWGMAFTTAKVSTLRSSDFLICCVDAAQTQAGVTLPGHTMALEIKPGMQVPPAPVAPPTTVAPAPNPGAFVPRPASPAASFGAAPLPPQPDALSSLPTGWNDGPLTSAPVSVPHPAEPALERRSANMGMYVLGGCVVLSAAILYVGLLPKEQPPQTSPGQSQPAVQTTPAEQPLASSPIEKTKPEDKEETDTPHRETERPDGEGTPQKDGAADTTAETTDSSAEKSPQKPQDAPSFPMSTSDSEDKADNPPATEANIGNGQQPCSSATASQTSPVSTSSAAPSSNPPPAPAPEPPPSFLEKGLSMALEPKNDKRFSVVLSCSVTREEIVKTFRLTPNCHLYWEDNDSEELEKSRQLTKVIHCNYPVNAELQNKIKNKEQAKEKFEKEIKGYNDKIAKIEADSQSNVSANASPRFKKNKEESNKKQKDAKLAGINKQIESIQKNLNACTAKLAELKTEAEQAKAEATRAKQEQYRDAKIRISVSERGPNVYIVGFEYVMPENNNAHE